MKPLTTFGYYQLTWFSKPAADRQIYQTIRKQQVSSIVEFGMDDGTRCQQMIRVATRYSATELKYTGVDLFDSRGANQSPLKLIEMHRTVKALPAKTRLVPGELRDVMHQIANSHLRTDLLIISSSCVNDDLDAAMIYMPRMLHAGSVVMIQRKPDSEFEILHRLDIERWAERSTKQSSRKVA